MLNKEFWDSDGNITEKSFYWCSNVRGFLELVARKVLDECNLKIGARDF